MLMRSNKDETAVHGCHWPGDMTVCMLKVLINESINESFILTRYAEELKILFKIRTCKNKIYHNYSHVILFNFKNSKKPHTKNVTRITIILVLKTVKSYNRARHVLKNCNRAIYFWSPNYKTRSIKLKSRNLLLNSLASLERPLE